MKFSEFTIMLVKSKHLDTNNPIPSSNIIKKTIVNSSKEFLSVEFARLLDNCNGNISNLLKKSLYCVYVDNRDIKQSLNIIDIADVLKEKDKYKFIVNELYNNEILAILDSRKDAKEFIQKQDKYEYDCKGDIVAEKEFLIQKIRYYKEL